MYEPLTHRAQMALAWPAPKEAEDLSPDLRQSTAELDGELRRAIQAKETAVAEADFETAAALRDDAVKLKRKKDTIIREWMRNYPIDPAWLSWSGGAVLKLAQRIRERCRWDALPELANVLEQAGCTDAEILKHCREGSEHSSQCWVIDLLLAHT